MWSTRRVAILAFGSAGTGLLVGAGLSGVPDGFRVSPLKKLAASTSALVAQPGPVPHLQHPDVKSSGGNVPALPSPHPAELGPSRASQIMVHGFPGYANLRTFEDYVLSYDSRNRTAYWVCEHLTPDRLEYHPEVDRAKCDFRADPSQHQYFRADNSDYKGSGYDRGHLAAAGNHRRSQNSVDQTFWLSNISPQVGKGFNRDKWNDLEKHARKLAKHSLNTYIVTGPLYLPKKEADGSLYVKYKVIGANNVAVPTHFFKAILVEKGRDDFHLEAYILPNEKIEDSTPLNVFHVPIDVIERSAGFLIFDKLPKAKIRTVNGKKAGGWW